MTASVYDCSTCRGAARVEERDCAECGGTGWHPPTRPADCACADCERDLWRSKRGPVWYEHRLTGETVCYFCLAVRIETKIERRRRRNPTPKPDSINLEDYVA